MTVIEDSGELPDSSEKPPSGSGRTGLTLESGAGLERSDAPRVQPHRWEDWRWQMRYRIRDVQQLLRAFPGLHSADEVEEAAQTFPLALTPYYASLIERLDDSDPIFRMAVPSAGELIDRAFLREDPLEEDEDMPVPGLVHRYPDRALLLATTTCGSYCRHCTRKRVAGEEKERAIGGRDLERIVRYLGDHPEVKDVIISGGDPFTLPTRQLESVVSAVRSVRTVEIVRIGTRTPVVMPMRITENLAEMLRRYQPIFVNTHFNHPAELTERAIRACGMLIDAGIPVNNQTVLLRGVNDDPQILEELFRGLLRSRVRPYYLFQCDLVRGAEHFRTPLTRGLEIMEYLRGRLSGLAIPTFVVDAPHGGGKIPLLPNYIVSQSPTHTVLRNFEGVLTAYPEPGYAIRRENGQRTVAAIPGVWELATGRATHIRPARTERHERRAAAEDGPSDDLA